MKRRTKCLLHSVIVASGMFAGGVAVSAQTPSPAPAASPEAASVIGAVQRLFDAMATRDTAVIRSLLLPGTHFVSFQTGAAGARPRSQADTAFIRAIGSATGLLERMWSPVVQVNGNLATLWAPYDFHVNGQFSHCGIDTAILVKTDAGWQLSALAYTVQRTGCDPSPLGPPR